MPRAITNAKLNSRDARIKAKLLPRSEPYWQGLEKGLAVGYFKGKNGGTWVARHFSTQTGRRKTALGNADDHTDPNGRDVLSFDQAQTKARDWRDQLLREDSGEEKQSGSYTVTQAMADYLADKERDKRKRMPETHAAINAHIIPALGRIEVDKLSHSKVKAWRDALADAAPRRRTKDGKPQEHRIFDATDNDAVRRRQASANRILTILKAALNYAHEGPKRVQSKALWRDVKPFRRVDAPKVRFLTHDEVAGLIRSCETEFAKLVKGALLTGCRYGELTAMAVSAFDAEQARVFVAQSKNGESRHVDLNDEGVALFASLTAKRTGGEHIFVKANGKPWMKSEQKRPMDAACEAAAIKEVTFHILRHTYASHAVMNGMPIAVLSEHLGHKDTRITERHYAHLASGYKQKLIRANAPSFGFMPVAAPRPQLVTRAS